VNEPAEQPAAGGTRAPQQVNPSSRAAAEPIVRMVGIAKHFGPIEALRGADLDLYAGEILGLVGDNAAGKSTFMKILYGALPPDEGWIEVDGGRVRWKSPRDAQAQGISMAYQDLGLFNNLDVAANVFAGREVVRRILGIHVLRNRPMHQESMELLQRLKIDIQSSELLVSGMSGGQRQMVAAARAVGYRTRVLIMDEPTAALGVKETASLLDLLVGLREEGVSIILITHRIADLLEIGDRILVLKGGRTQGVLDARECDLEDIERLIVRGGDDASDAEAVLPRPGPT
jgi:ABC-type sugar transport system ATPase subunit